LDVSLYFHIPFCTKKCPYCHFYSLPDQAGLQSIFQTSIALEWQRKVPLLAGNRIVSIYFGGGTPTLFAPQGIGAILQMIAQSDLNIAPDCEITIEANPEKIDLQLLKELRRLTINRISIGVQSLDDQSLQILNRAHTARQAENAVHDAYAAGFENISIDLMYDLPWQTETSWSTTLNRIRHLPITHSSLYNLTIEPHTLFYQKQKDLRPAMPSPAKSLRLLNMAIYELENLKLHRYEISAFAKNNMISRHNSGYWTGRPFLGFGPSAFSYWDSSRFQNVAHLHRYAQALTKGESIIAFSETLPYPANVNELFAIQLRMIEGVSEAKFPLPPDTIANLQKLKQAKLLTCRQNQWKLTKRGTLFYDTVAESIISEEDATQSQQP